jgi:radical SAM superfamily enzyme YgiQ (UPF0313 family)
MSNITNKKYHAIFIGGNLPLWGGRVIAGFRLRTALQNYGYDMLVLDSASVMTAEKLLSLLDKVITDETLVIGFSTIWMNQHLTFGLDWCNNNFFSLLKTSYPNIKIVAGGPKNHWINKSKIIYKNCDWIFDGFSDESFPKFLNYLTKKPNHGFKYFIENGKKVISSNEIFPVVHPDHIETRYEIEDNFLPHQPIPLEVSRGCIFKCAFCHHPFQSIKDPDKYIRTPQNLANELKRNYEMFGTFRYTILDDTFNDSMEKLDRLHRAIDLAKMSKFEFVSYIKPELLVTKPEMIPKLIDMGLSSGYIGMESLNQESRKSIHKGMDSKRILDVIATVRSKSNITFEGSFIVGLPYESVAEVYQTHEFLKQNTDTLFTSWHFHALSMFFDTNLKGMSELEKDPEKFGYVMGHIKPDSFAGWKSKYMNSIEADVHTNKLNSMVYETAKAAGWNTALAWHLDLPEEDVKNLILKDLNFEKRSFDCTMKMSLETLARFNVE